VRPTVTSCTPDVVVKEHSRIQYFTIRGTGLFYSIHSIQTSALFFNSVNFSEPVFFPCVIDQLTSWLDVIYCQTTDAFENYTKNTFFHLNITSAAGNVTFENAILLTDAPRIHSLSSPSYFINDTVTVSARKNNIPLSFFYIRWGESISIDVDYDMIFTNSRTRFELYMDNTFLLSSWNVTNFRTNGSRLAVTMPYYTALEEKIRFMAAIDSYR
jgi:hypothetical protein